MGSFSYLHANVVILGDKGMTKRTERPSRNLLPSILKSLAREKSFLILLISIFLVFVLVRTFAVRQFVVPSPSMTQTLQVQDRILVNEFQPSLVPLERGQIVVFRDPGAWLGESTETAQFDPVGAVSDWGMALFGVPTDRQFLVKRLIGLPGDHIQCTAPCKTLLINGTPVSEPYLSDESVDASNTSFDVVVPANSLWVMGDNRVGSADSRSHVDQPGGGFVPIKNVVGTVFAVTWPLDHLQLIGDQGTKTFRELIDK